MLISHALIPTLQDASVGGSDSAEEVAWTPGEGAVPAAPRSALPSTMRQETSAAINLLTMSYKDDKVRTFGLQSVTELTSLSHPL